MAGSVRMDEILGGRPGGAGGRSHLLKATRRLGRTMRTEAKLFFARPTRRRPWMRPCAVILGVLALCATAIWLFWPGEWHVHDGHIARESGHFTHNARILPLGRQLTWDDTDFKPCSWLYFEVNAGDGRHTHAFFTNGNGFLEEILRASQASMRGFCAVVIEPDPQMGAPLTAVRSEKGQKAKQFDVFAGVAAGSRDGTEDIRLRDAVDAGSSNGGRVVSEQDVENVRAIPLVDTLRRLTRPLSESGIDAGNGMTIAMGNRQNGTVVVRLNVHDIREAYWYLDLLDSSGVLCERVDRLIVNLQPMAFDASRHYLVDRVVNRELDSLVGSPSSERFDHSRGHSGILDFGRDVSERPTCRTMVHVIDSRGKNVFPRVISERSVFYAVLAGHPTFDERVGAQTASWMTGVPRDRVAVYTNIERTGDELNAARGRDVVFTQPTRPELEGQLHMMQSWSHLVRVRETWDRYMRNDPEIKWLMLVDDDTFVFPGGLREYLTNFDHRRLGWGGSGEQARIDNGDAGQFAVWLRELNTKHGGAHCYLPHEDIPRNLRGRRITFGRSAVMNGRRVAHIVSHMCSDAFCRRGCPAVPQGATIFVSRALVQAVRPHIEECEQATSKLCKNCGSQRLYMCVNRFVDGASTFMTRGICRATWRLEHRPGWPFALSYHGFQKYRRISMSTGSIGGDMAELWQLGKAVEEAAKLGRRNNFLVPMQRVADLIGCRGQGVYKDGKCVSPDGIDLHAHDGSSSENGDRPGERAADRKGSA